jgi:hypothetical protein
LLSANVGEAVWTHNEAVEGLWDKGKRVLGINSAKIGLEVLGYFLRLCLFLLTIDDCSHILGDFFEAETFHPAIFSLGLIAPN